MTETNASTAPISKRALVHLGVFLALFVVTLFSAGRPQRVGIRELKLPSLEADEITAITVDGKNKAVLKKEGGTWSVADPATPDKVFPVEKSVMDRALKAIAELETGAFVTGRSEKHAELEIDDDKGLQLNVTGGKGKQLSLVVGRFAKGGGNYIRTQGSDEVFVGKGTLMGALGKDAKAWRKKDVIDVEEADLVEVVVAVAGATPYTLVRGPSAPAGEGEEPKPGDWQLKAGTPLPEGFRLDEAALKRIPGSFARLRAADFIDEAVADTGISAGASVVTAKTADGKTLSVTFGNEDDKKRVYAQVTGDPQLYVVNSYTQKNVAKPLTGLRDLTLLPGLAADKVSALTITGPEGRATFTQTDGAWALTAGEAPADKPIDLSTVSQKLAQLSRLRATQFVGQGAPFKAGAGAVTLSLTVEGEAAPRTVVFGAELPKDQDAPSTNLVGVKVSDGFVYGIAKFQKDRFGKVWDLFKKVAPPPGAGGGGGIPGMENLPPDIRKQLEAQLRSGQFPGAN